MPRDDHYNDEIDCPHDDLCYHYCDTDNCNAESDWLISHLNDTGNKHSQFQHYPFLYSNVSYKYDKIPVLCIGNIYSTCCILRVIHKLIFQLKRHMNNPFFSILV